MRHDFRTIATATACICCALAAIWLFAPRLLLAMWAVGYSYPVGFMARRSAALFAGIALMLFLARDAAPSLSRSAMAKGIIAGCCLLAISGVVELCAGHAGPGILIAVMTELAIAAAFIAVERALG